MLTQRLQATKETVLGKQKIRVLRGLVVGLFGFFSRSPLKGAQCIWGGILGECFG